MPTRAKLGLPAALLLAGWLGMATAASGTGLQGVWHAPGVRLTLQAGGAAMLEAECATGRTSGPLAAVPSAAGRYEARGTWEPHAQGQGPQRADGPAPTPVLYRAELMADGQLELTIGTTPTPQVFLLRPGPGPKLIRCL